ncbi:MAG: pyridoxal-phosphate dependent enzyme, partial [Marinilabiliales bacterium]
MEIPRWQDVLDAHERIAGWVHRTPVLTSRAIDRIAGCELLFKCENFQKVGAFKFRGATNAVFSLDPASAGKGVATHSSGNHAAALALAASNRGINAHIVMPVSAPDIKKKAVSGYGAEITWCEPTLEARESTLEKVVSSSGATFIHPYNNFEVISGQATAAKELIEETGPPDIIIVPVGGGGLLSGTAITAKSMSSRTRVLAAEPEKADDAYRSFRTGVLQPALPPATVADGLLTSLGPLTFRIVREYVDDIICVSEQGIVDAMRLVWERMKIIIEPSSAVPLAAVLNNRDLFAGTRTGIILTGGNADL